MNALFEKPFSLSMGPAKCGAGWLMRYFEARGDVCLPKDVREIFFFDRHFQRGQAFYASHFEPKDNHQLVMELSTTAFDSQEAPQRVHDLFGNDVNLLCPLREPVERSYAVYREYLLYGIVSGRISEAVDQAPQILYGSRYIEHFERWAARFGEDKIKVVFYEQRKRDQIAYVKEICDYLSMPYVDPIEALQAVKEPRAETLPKLINDMMGLAKKPDPAEADPENKDEDLQWLRERLGEESSQYEKAILDQ